MLWLGDQPLPTAQSRRLAFVSHGRHFTAPGKTTSPQNDLVKHLARSEIAKAAAHSTHTATESETWAFMRPGGTAIPASLQRVPSGGPKIGSTDPPRWGAIRVTGAGDGLSQPGRRKPSYTDAGRATAPPKIRFCNSLAISYPKYASMGSNREIGGGGEKAFEPLF